MMAKNHTVLFTTPEPGLQIEAVILAGGLGTRLQDAVPDLPKCMAPVAGRPFLYYVINELQLQGVNHFIFSLGFKHELIEGWLKAYYPRLNYEVVIETEPLGTGGAILFACTKAKGKDVLITNGDTLFRTDVSALLSLHHEKKAECTLALKLMNNFDRYGAVMIKDNLITHFSEKQFYKEGLINGGFYILDKQKFESGNWPARFSFEKEFLEPLSQSNKLAGLPQDGYFIDIGIPTDFNQAQADLAQKNINLKKIDKSWTLFLDRDGVINEDKPNGYILNADEFIFYDGLLSNDDKPGAFKKFAELFGRIIIITNQRGVGRELMTIKDLDDIHEKLVKEVTAAGGRIDHIYYCPSADKKDPGRKPNLGMAVQIKKDFPQVDFGHSIMVGNNFSDMQFGKNAGMHTVFVKTTNSSVELPYQDIDLLHNSLADFAKGL
jgi:D-glycero-alpha-D-manno-heptose 1-phosphate guanylyltransferase